MSSEPKMKAWCGDVAGVMKAKLAQTHPISEALREIRESLECVAVERDEAREERDNYKAKVAANIVEISGLRVEVETWRACFVEITEVGRTLLIDKEGTDGG